MPPKRKASGRAAPLRQAAHRTERAARYLRRRANIEEELESRNQEQNERHTHPSPPQRQPTHRQSDQGPSSQPSDQQSDQPSDQQSSQPPPIYVLPEIPPPGTPDPEIRLLSQPPSATPDPEIRLLRRQRQRSTHALPEIPPPATPEAERRLLRHQRQRNTRRQRMRAVVDWQAMNIAQQEEEPPVPEQVMAEPLVPAQPAGEALGQGPVRFMTGRLFWLAERIGNSYFSHARIKRNYLNGVLNLEQAQTALAISRYMLIRFQTEFVTVKANMREMQQHMTDLLSEGDNEIFAAYMTSLENRIPNYHDKFLRSQSDDVINQYTSRVRRYYEIMPRLIDGKGQDYCQVLGWTPTKSRSMPLVSYSLSREALAYIFGGPDINCDDPRNGLILHESIRYAILVGHLAIVPQVVGHIPTFTRYKCFLLNTSIANDPIAKIPGTTSILWRDVDGTYLEFGGNGHPFEAALYFRYVTSRLLHRRFNEPKDIDNPPAHWDNVWTVARPYLRRSTMQIILNVISDSVLPESFYRDMTFDETEYNYLRRTSAREETILGMSIALELLVEYQYNRLQFEQMQREQQQIQVC
ncbi:hypothetical protein FQN57_006283 [Myotisia sp. PD_48]|nr:hypothetical protein FQN57_006283 [Myotisia sp. PD_48]